MNAVSRRLRFVSAKPALLRATCHPASSLSVAPVPDLADVSQWGVSAARQWAQITWASPAVRDAVRHASPVLAHSLDALTAGEDIEADRAHGMLLSLAAYCHRMATRATPFGLFAGIAETAFGPNPQVRWGDEHQAVARADSRWLTEVIGTLESIPPVREQLWLVASTIATRRAERLVVPWQPRQLDATGTEVHEISLRLEPEVRVLIDLAASPVRYSDLFDEVMAQFAEHTADTVRSLLDELITHRVLSTCLHPPATETDALSYVLDQLVRVGAHQVPEVTELVADLHDIHQLMAHHNTAPAASGGPLRTHIQERMATHGGVAAQPIALDTVLDVDAVLPREVAWEAERAAQTLARISPEPYGQRHWRAYRDRFLDRYGPDAEVPLLQLTSPCGLGLPGGYHGTPTAGTAPHPLSHRDTVLLTVAQHAVLTGGELVLDDQLADRIAVGDPSQMTLPPHLELLAEVHSPTIEALTDGNFELAVRGTSRGWGHLSGGRFAALLTTRPTSPLLRTLAQRPTSTQGALPAQLSFPALTPSAGHIARTPQVMPAVISLAEHRDPAADLIALSDLAVMCDGHVLHLLSRSRGQIIEASSMQPLQIECQTPVLARFLDELVRGQVVQMTGPTGTLRPMHWGAAGRLPVLPRLRAGRSVLSPAMWQITPTDLPGPRASMDQWHDAFAALRTQRHIPQHVQLEIFDHRIGLDLDSSGDLSLLRTRTTDNPWPMHFVEAPARDAFGWCGRPAEIVTLLRPAHPARTAPNVRALAQPSHHTAHQPGASRYIHTHLFGPAQGRRDIITDHLPALLADLGQPLWWTRPHDGRDPHLELTIRLCDPTYAGHAVQQLGTWAEHLVATGALRDITLIPYRPHTGLWGEGPVLEAAEEVAAADSVVIAHQLTTTRDTDQHVLAAINLLDIADGFLGSQEAGRAWLVSRPKTPASGPLAHDTQRETTRLADNLTNAQDGSPRAMRRHALAAYKKLLRAETIDTDRALDNLLHNHCLQTFGRNQEAEQISQRLARGHALAATKRTNPHRTAPAHQLPPFDSCPDAP
ncbi:lantibiotic dehydratase [Streptomyces zagrosensis]|uniref:Thiopeptide-type bacteriocin biosynthesis protein n=1 Tax=Streptomyces zagrosensis TaxID=1042984 RepID=A0A7W9V0W9_9ACTN|nr:lantibiotic dehydratase [Streptomyces zagrosensis]MBB5938673.1 thiopeptide-type bacteriocin biosynthesis protein [Streptomyces zagrosensis]